MLSKNDVTLLIVIKEAEQGARVYLSASKKGGSIRNAEKYLEEALDALLHYIVKIEKE